MATANLNAHFGTKLRVTMPGKPGAKPFSKMRDRREPRRSGPSELVLYWGRAELVSTGIESDAFLRLIDEVYGTAVGHARMRERVPFLVVSLAGDPSRLEGEPAKMKFFFESETEDRDAEFYVNIDVKTRSVQFHEKDADYRRGIVLALSAQA